MPAAALPASPSASASTSPLLAPLAALALLACCGLPAWYRAASAPPAPLLALPRGRVLTVLPTASAAALVAFAAPFHDLVHLDYRRCAPPACLASSARRGHGPTGPTHGGIRRDVATCAWPHGPAVGCGQAAQPWCTILCLAHPCKERPAPLRAARFARR